MKKLTLTIGIPTLNEEKNIEKLLVQIMKQNHEHFVLKEFIVYSDASTDRTHEIVENIAKHHRIIKLIKGSQRKGKYHRVNELFSLCKTDALVILDADIGLVGENFLNELISVLERDATAQLVAAHQKQLRPTTFIGKIIYTHFLVWDYVRWSIPQYHSARNYYGSATAYRGSFVRSIHIPTNISDPHLYIYLRADIMDGFRYCENAEMVQWPIATMRDYNKFLRRSIGKKDEALIKLFGQEYIDSTRFVHRKYKIIGVIKAFFHEPIFTPLSFLINIYMKLAPFIRDDKTANWDVVTSTKKEINN